MEERDAGHKLPPLVEEGSQGQTLALVEEGLSSLLQLSEQALHVARPAEVQVIGQLPGGLTTSDSGQRMHLRNPLDHHQHK